MVTTRSGKVNSSSNRRSKVRENITMKITPKKVQFQQIENFIYRTVNIQDMTDFTKIEKYRTQFTNCFYVLTSTEKSKIVFDYCPVTQLRENMCEYLMYNNNVLSSIDFTLYVVLTNKSYLILDKMIEFMNDTSNFKIDIEMYKTKSRTEENYLMTDKKYFTKVIQMRDMAVKQFL